MKLLFSPPKKMFPFPSKGLKFLLHYFKTFETNKMCPYTCYPLINPALQSQSKHIPQADRRLLCKVTMTPFILSAHSYTGVFQNINGQPPNTMDQTLINVEKYHHWNVKKLYAFCDSVTLGFTVTPFRFVPKVRYQVLGFSKSLFKTKKTCSHRQWIFFSARTPRC